MTCAPPCKNIADQFEARFEKFVACTFLFPPFKLADRTVPEGRVPVQIMGIQD
jgi:hypothetical protein